MKRADFDKWRKSMNSVLAEVKKMKKAGKSKEEVTASLKLEDHGWNVTQTAQSVETPRSNLYKKMEQYDIRREGS